MTGPYLLLWQQKTVTIVGPFTTDRDAIDFGEIWQATNGDRSGWQVLSGPGALSVSLLPVAA